MHVFNLVLVLLAAVIVSHLVTEFLPWLSITLTQIILGVIIALIPFGSRIEFEPELFFVLFISPLVFNSTMNMDKKTIRNMRNPIMLAAIGLVFVTVFAVGSFTHLLIPAIPLVAAFAMAASIAPTDVVVVEAVAKRVALPEKIMGILSGESIINDATGIVCFQFAIIAAETGSVDLTKGLLFFLGLSIGGLLVGVLLTILKYLLLRWFRSLYSEGASLDIAIGIITPFIIYLVAEGLGVSGILAVFSAGMIHSLYRDDMNPELLRVHNAQKSVWSMLTYILDGLVFVILGTQLPMIIRIETINDSILTLWEAAAGVILVTVLLIVTRALWWVVTVRSKTYSEPDAPIGKFKASMIFSLAGARGEVPLAIVLSIPLLLSNGDPFPERELIILMVSSVIVISLLVTNLILPLLVKKTAGSAVGGPEDNTRIEILQNVIAQLRETGSTDDLLATEIVIQHYDSRINQHLREMHMANMSGDKPAVKRRILFWEKDVVLRMVEDGTIGKESAKHYMEVVDHLMAVSGKERNPFKLINWIFRQIFQLVYWRAPKNTDEESAGAGNAGASASAGYADADAGNTAAKTTGVHALRGVPGSNGDYIKNQVIRVAAKGFHIERVVIQQMLTDGRCSWETAKEMQANITMLEAQLHME